ncbi:MAG: TolC family protein [Hydrogenibacillus sp.]|nr:TolC family protein [Hydrogenibacillus sp.]
MLHKRLLGRMSTAGVVVGLALSAPGLALPAVPLSQIVSPPAVAYASGAAEGAALQRITLEQAVARTLSSSRNARQLQYSMQIVDLQKQLSEDGKEKIDDLKEALDRQIEALWMRIIALAQLSATPAEGSGSTDQAPESTDQPLAPPALDPASEIEQLNRKIQELEQQRKELDFKADELDKQIEDYKRQKEKLELNAATLRETLISGVKQVYVGLLNVQDQLDLLKMQARIAEREVTAAQERYALGLISREARDQAGRSARDLALAAAQAERAYGQLRDTFAAWIGVPVSADLVLEPIAFDPRAVRIDLQEADTWIQQSFSYRQAELDLRQARADERYYRQERDRGNPQYEDTKAGKIAENTVKIKELALAQTEADIRRAVQDLLREVENARDEYERAKQKWQEATNDVSGVFKRQELGLVSALDADRARLKTKQAAVQMDEAKRAYFLAVEKLEALKRGYIEVNNRG